MASSPAAEGRLDSIDDLPRLSAPLALTVPGEHGLLMGEVWWMDARELVFWTAEPAPLRGEALMRVDLRRNNVVDLSVSGVPGEEPCRHRNGTVQVARWVARSGDAAPVLDVVKAMNPAAFVVGYRPVRLPAAAPAFVERRAGQVELQEAREAAARELATAEAALARARRGRWTGLFGGLDRKSVV